MSDWRNAEEYAYCERLTPRGWAWEFLRRNQVYRQMWREYEAASVAVAEGGSVRTSHFAFDAAALPFGLLQPVDPSQAAGTARNLQWDDSAAIHVGVVEEWHYHREEGWPGYPSKIAISFDFRLPLTPQIDEAIQILRCCEAELVADKVLPGILLAESKGRARLDKYPTYIRMLDAKQGGENVYQIAKYFGKSWTAVQQSIQAAEEMCRGGYRGLLLKSSTTTK
jgi:hypothetical protein